MATAFQQPVQSYAEQRSQTRETVRHTSFVTLASGKMVQALVVDASPRGLMARCDAPVAGGDLIFVKLPVVGTVRAQVRWTLAGRFGCQLKNAIGDADFALMLGTMAATGRGASI